MDPKENFLFRLSVIKTLIICEKNMTIWSQQQSN